MRRQTILPFEIEQTDAPLMARGGLVLPYEMAKAMKLPEVIDGELPPPASGGKGIQALPVCYAPNLDVSRRGKEAGGLEGDKGGGEPEEAIGHEGTACFLHCR